MNRLLNLVHMAVEERMPLQVTVMLTDDTDRIQALPSQGGLGMLWFILFSCSLQDPKSMSAPLTVSMETNWRRPGKLLDGLWSQTVHALKRIMVKQFTMNQVRQRKL